MPGRDGGENRGALRAVREPVRRVLHVAAGEDVAIRRQQRRADMKVGVGGVGGLCCLRRAPACSLRWTRG